MFIKANDQVVVAGTVEFKNLVCKKVHTDENGNTTTDAEILNGEAVVNITVDLKADDTVGGIIGIINAMLGKSSFAKKLGLKK